MLLTRLQLEPCFTHNRLGSPFRGVAAPAGVVKGQWPGSSGEAELHSKAGMIECWHTHCSDMGLSAPIFSHLCSRNRNWERSRAESDPEDIFRLQSPSEGDLGIFGQERGELESISLLSKHASR